MRMQRKKDQRQSAFCLHISQSGLVKLLTPVLHRSSAPTSRSCYTNTSNHDYRSINQTMQNSSNLSIRLFQQLVSPWSNHSNESIGLITLDGLLHNKTLTAQTSSSPSCNSRDRQTDQQRQTDTQTTGERHQMVNGIELEKTVRRSAERPSQDTVKQEKLLWSRKFP